jgi:hypothetical protein
MSESKDGRELRLEIEIAASPETVFALLTQAAGLKTWLSDLVMSDCRPGGLAHHRPTRRLDRRNVSGDCPEPPGGIHLGRNRGDGARSDHCRVRSRAAELRYASALAPSRVARAETGAALPGLGGIRPSQAQGVGGRSPSRNTWHDRLCRGAGSWARITGWNG